MLLRYLQGRRLRASGTYIDPDTTPIPRGAAKSRVPNTITCSYERVFIQSSYFLTIQLAKISTASAAFRALIFNSPIDRSLSSAHPPSGRRTSPSIRLQTGETFRCNQMRLLHILLEDHSLRIPAVNTILEVL